MRYFKDGNGFRAVTDESPKGFKGIVFIGRGGPTPATVTEQAWAVNQLQGLTPVDLAEVPPEWVEALGYDEIIEEPIFDLAGEELLDLAPVRVRRAAPIVEQDAAWWARPLGFAIAAILFLAWLAFSR